MTTLTLSRNLLSVLCALKAKQHLSVTETHLDGFTNDWVSVTRQYFFNLPDALVGELGLKKNEYCFRAICSLTIPEEWMETPAKDLHQFRFGY